MLLTVFYLMQIPGVQQLQFSWRCAETNTQSSRIRPPHFHRSWVVGSVMEVFSGLSRVTELDFYVCLACFCVCSVCVCAHTLWFYVTSLLGVILFVFHHTFGVLSMLWFGVKGVLRGFKTNSPLYQSNKIEQMWIFLQLSGMRAFLLFYID